MKIIKPLTLSTLHKPYTYRGKHYFSVGALGFFQLGNAADSSNIQRFELEAQHWQEVAKQLPQDIPLDMAMPKGRAEFLVSGHAYSDAAPTSQNVNDKEKHREGQQVKHMPVGASVGEVNKVLLAIGERRWFYGMLGMFHISEPEPFYKMPLGYEQAFGGEGLKTNFKGKGYYGNSFARFFGKNLSSMPNLEYPENPISSHTKKVAPAAFGPIDIRCQQRMQWAGRYGKQWLKQGFPGLADNVDFRLFNIAAQDQWAGQFWQGGEPYQLRGMSATQPQIEGTLPDFRVRAMVRKQCQQQSSEATKHNAEQSGQEQPLKEQPLQHATDASGFDDELLDLHADTVWFFPDINIGVMIYRGQTEIQDSDALDVKALLLAYESVTETPRSLQHYQQQMLLRTDRATAGLQAMNEAPLIPRPISDNQHQQRTIQPTALQQTLAQRSNALTEELKTQVSQSMAQLGTVIDTERFSDSEIKLSDEPELTTAELSVPTILSQPLTIEQIADGGIDITEAIATLQADAEHLQTQQMQVLENSTQEIQQLVSKLSDDMDVHQSEQHRLEEKQWQECLQKALHLPADLHPEQGQVGQDIATVLELINDNSSDMSMSETQAAAIVEPVLSIEALQRQARAIQTEPNDSDLSLTENNARKLGEQLRQFVCQLQPLSGRDFTGVQLHSMDFTGLDLREMNFAGADLRHCCFAKTNLQGANFLNANLDDACFDDANLTKANLSHVSANRASFQRACLKQALLTKTQSERANFTAADLTSVMATQAVFSEAVLKQCQLKQAVMTDLVASHSDFQQANFEQTLLNKAELSGSNFSEAVMNRSVVSDVSAEQTCWHNTRATRCFFGKAVLNNSEWKGADFRLCGLREAVLNGCNLQESTFYQCDLSQAQLISVNLTQAVLCRSLFSQALIERAHCQGADFYQAICRKTMFYGCDLRQASFVHAEMGGVDIQNSELQGIKEVAA